MQWERKCPVQHWVQICMSLEVKPGSTSGYTGGAASHWKHEAWFMKDTGFKMGIAGQTGKHSGNRTIKSSLISLIQDYSATICTISVIRLWPTWMSMNYTAWWWGRFQIDLHQFQLCPSWAVAFTSLSQFVSQQMGSSHLTAVPWF